MPHCGRLGNETRHQKDPLKGGRFFWYTRTQKMELRPRNWGQNVDLFLGPFSDVERFCASTWGDVLTIRYREPWLAPRVVPAVLLHRICQAAHSSVVAIGGTIAIWIYVCTCCQLQKEWRRAQFPAGPPVGTSMNCMVQVLFLNSWSPPTCATSTLSRI